MRGNEVGGVWAVGGASSRAGSGGVAMGRWAGLRGRGVVVGVAMRLGAESGVPNGTGLGGVASTEAGPGERWAGPGEKWVGPALWGRGQDDPPTHTQVEELSGQRAAAALQVERWQRECRSLQERFEALSQEREVRPPPPTSRTPHTPPYIPSGFLSLFQRLLEERDALREANEELRCAQVQQSCLQQAGEWGSQRGGQGGHSSYKGRSPHKGPGPHKGHCDLPSVCHSGQRCLHGGSDSDARDPPPGVSCCVCVCVSPTQIKAVFLPFRCTAGWECGPSGKPGGRNPPR